MRKCIYIALIITLAIAITGCATSAETEQNPHPTPRPEPAPVPVPTPLLDLGSTAIIIGDSITVNASDAIKNAIPDITINAQYGRFMSEGYSIIMDLQDAGDLPETVIVALGTNMSLETDSYIDKIIRDINAGHRLLFVVPYAYAGGYESAHTFGTADYVRALPGSYDFITITDWAAAAYDNPGVIDGDKVHLTRHADGRNLFASIVAAGLSEAAESPVK